MEWQVLLVEDSDDQAYMTGRQLRLGLPGCTIDRLVSLAELRRLTPAQLAAYSLAVVDLGLPDSQGVDTVTKVVNLCRETPVVVVTGLQDYDLGELAIRAGAQDYISKDDLNPPMISRVARYAVQRFETTLELRRLNDQLEYLATHDALSGLPNGERFLALLDQSVARAQRHSQQLAVAFLDVDDFKFVNDTWGHAAGDELIRVVGARLRAGLREGDTVGRMGGDEFAVLFEQTTDGMDLHALGRILVARVETPCSLLGNEYVPRISVGMAKFPADAPDGTNLMRLADIAMYQAKSADSISVAIADRPG